MSSLFSSPKFQALDAAGAPIPAAQLYFTETATSTPLAVYADRDLNTPLSNPVISDAYGVFVPIWLQDQQYRVRLATAAGVTLWTTDEVGEVLDAETIGAALYPISAEETAAGVTPTAYQFPYHDIRRFGADPTGAVDSVAAIQSAMAACPNGGQVYAPSGTYKIVGTLSLSGYGCGIRGDGASHDGSAPTGTVFHGAPQTGPVIDLTGWEVPNSFRGRVRFESFTVRGDGVANTANKGVYIPSKYSMSWRDVTIMDTGGVGFDCDKTYVSEFEAITVVTPVSCAANDVPYFRFAGVLGNRLIGLGLRGRYRSRTT
jgi:hypothetical protein